MTPELLKKMMPRCNVDKWCEPLNKAMDQFGIDTINRKAGFLASIAVESLELTTLVENMNYKAETLCKTWPKRFPTIESATPYAHNPQKLANHVYCNRNGNGDEASNDGWNFRGRGPIQTTGRTNYTRATNKLGCDYISQPECITLPMQGSLAAAFFFSESGAFAKCDVGDMAGIRKCVNGGTIGLKEFKVYFPKIKKILLDSLETPEKVSHGALFGAV